MDMLTYHGQIKAPNYTCRPSWKIIYQLKIFHLIVITVLTFCVDTLMLPIKKQKYISILQCNIRYIDMDNYNDIIYLP